MKEKIIGAILAYNEEDWIGAVIPPFLESKTEGTLDDCLVVDDGSTDSTASISEQLGIQVLSHKDKSGVIQNRGKSQAYITAAKYAHSQDADILFVSDADMIDLTTEQISYFLGKIDGKTNLNMIRAAYEQGDTAYCPFKYSGFRAIRIDALQPMINKDHPDHSRWEKYLSKPFALEAALEVLVLGPEYGSSICIKGLASREVHGGASTAQEIREGIAHVAALNWRVQQYS